MKSVGEVMAIGRTFKEALQKALRSLEQDRAGLGLDRPPPDLDDAPRPRCGVPNADRLFYSREALRRGLGASRRSPALTRIDPWFLAPDGGADRRSRRRSRRAPRRSRARRSGTPSASGFSDRRSPTSRGRTEAEVRRGAGARTASRAVFKRVDTCAAEFAAHTPYLYSTYEDEDEAPPDATAAR